MNRKFWTTYKGGDVVLTPHLSLHLELRMSFSSRHPPPSVTVSYKFGHCRDLRLHPINPPPLQDDTDFELLRG